MKIMKLVLVVLLFVVTLNAQQRIYNMSKSEDKYMIEQKIDKNS